MTGQISETHNARPLSPCRKFWCAMPTKSSVSHQSSASLPVKQNFHLHSTCLTLNSILFPPTEQVENQPNRDLYFSAQQSEIEIAVMGSFALLSFTSLGYASEGTHRKMVFIFCPRERGRRAAAAVFIRHERIVLLALWASNAERDVFSTWKTSDGWRMPAWLRYWSI